MTHLLRVTTPLVVLLTGCVTDEAVVPLYDQDGDGWYDPAVADRGIDGPYDCDDQDGTIHPEGTEVCDSVDDDCDGETDEGDAAPHTFYVDADGDGFGDAETSPACSPPDGAVDVSGDCDDANADAHPGAGEVWYDDVDEACDGGDDFDADGDGADSDLHGGTDCSDDDDSVHPDAAESWTDLGVDNDCDGDLDDPIALDARETPHIDGEAGEGFGSVLLGAPVGWNVPALVVGAPNVGSYTGAVHAWTRDDLALAASSADASWTVTGADGSVFGAALGWAGDSAEPVLLASGEAENGGEGTVYGWKAAAIGSARDGATFAIQGDRAGMYLGNSMARRVDVDGDGIDDAVFDALLDDRTASAAGSVAVFLAPTALSGTVSYVEADALYTTTEAGARLKADAVGDVDGDGRDDLGFTQQVTGTAYAGGLVVTEADRTGVLDVEALASISLFGGPFTFGGTVDLDGDGDSELVAASGPVYQFDLPLSGTITPWDDAVGTSGFDDPDVYVGLLRCDLPYWAGHDVLATAPEIQNDQGVLVLDRMRYGASESYDTASLTAVGGATGDSFGAALDLLDTDGDSVLDLAVGAPGADSGGAGAGAVYLLPAPR